MPTQITKLRYLKAFHNKHTFIASADRADEVKTYEKLAKIHSKLAATYPDARLPSYEGSGFYSITVVLDKRQQPPSQDFTYTLDLVFKRNLWNGQPYINAFVQRAIQGPRVKRDEGEEIDLGDL